MQRLTLILAMFGWLSAAGAYAVDETKEPPLKLTVLVNGKPIPFQLNREQKLAGEFKNPTILVRAATTRQFSYGGISFDYPSNFTWETDIEGKSYRNWNLSGSETVIMVFVLDYAFTPESYAKEIVEELDVKNVTIKPISRKFGQLNLKGKRVVMTLGEIDVVQEAFAIPVPKNQWCLLVLQDVTPKLTPKLKEPKLVLDLLTKSLTVKK